MENEVIDGGKELEIADLTETDVEESVDQVTTETSEEETEATATSKEEKNEKQSAEENAKYAKARRKAEEESQKKSDSAYERGLREGRLNALKGKMNPYTNTLIEDEQDIEVYEDMYKISQEGGDPLMDYAAYTADKKRQAEKARIEETQIQEKAQKDVDEFMEKYPNVNLTELLKDEMFADYIEGKNKSLCDLYTSYKKMQNQFRNKGIETAKQTIANSMSSPGGLSGGAETYVDYSNMSREEFLKEVEKVKSGIK